MEKEQIVEQQNVDVLEEDVQPKAKELGIGLLLGIGCLTILPVLVMIILMMFVKVLVLNV